MKKLYTKPEYKRKHKRRLLRIEIRRRNWVPRKKLPKKKERQLPLREVQLKPIVIAPSDFRLLENPEACMRFFSDLRSEEYLNEVRGISYVRMTLRNVAQIDYAAISILTAINDDMASRKLVIQGDLPADRHCLEELAHSGYLNHVRDQYGRKFPVLFGKSDLIYFEKGKGKLSESDLQKISHLVRSVVDHLNGNAMHRLPIKTIILEICGNSIEWGGTENKLWLLGVKYEAGKVIFTVTDVGKGILETLHRKFPSKFWDSLFLRGDKAILARAFMQKYGSKSEELNRNKGLPSVKDTYDKGLIQNLKVVTNGVILHFDNDHLSKDFQDNFAFNGTFYQWQMTEQCITKIA